MKGKVKWFNGAKGYGFISRVDTGEDIFVHYKAIQGGGYQTLTEGESVTFDIEKGPKGLMASNVIREAQDEEQSEHAQVESEFVALGLFGDKIRLVTLTADGTYKFIDGAQSLHSIIYLATSETLNLQRAVDELESLVNDPNTKELDFQDFFERNPEFILNDEYKSAHPHIVLAKDDGESLIPDFVLEPINQSALSDILELKLPSSEIFVLKKGRMRYSAAILEACSQLRDYSLYFDEEKNRKKVYEKYGLLAFKPKMFVVIGRKGSISPLEVRKAQMDIPSIQLRTYDDIVARMKSRIEAMKKGKIK